MLRGVSLVAVALVLVGCNEHVWNPAEDDDEELSTTSQGLTCGVERWAVKTGTDADKALVNVTPVDTTIATLIGYPAPSSFPSNNRILPQEATVYRLKNVTLTQYKLESDSDYHLVLSDGANTMIAEIPNPGCVGSGSIFASGISAAKAAFDAKHTATTSFQTANDTVTVVGAGFFDLQHGQTGVAPNAIELHAITSICFGLNCAGSGGGGGGGNLISNGGFEGSLSGWTLGGVKNPIDSTAREHAGSYSMRVGATTGSGVTEPDGDSWGYQQVTIPSSATTAMLSFWYSTYTTDTITYDWQDAQLQSSSGATLINIFHQCTSNSAWTQRTVDVSAYRGQTVRVWFNAHGDGFTDPTTLWVDDVQLNWQ
ncbi:MAG TPA: hypothetical protein VFA20_28585 [Myxococcaceae bacterium]|nr:hypothetical protein [Myxococcaceae bacterium]